MTKTDGHFFQSVRQSFLVSLLVVLICFGIGSKLSEKLILWTDEIYTQVEIIDKSSYLDLVLLKSNGINQSPLFYLIQKAICDIADFRFPFKWNGERFMKDVDAQRTMRLSSNIFMSLSIGLIFLYFSTHYSYGSGVLAVLMTLSSYLIWSYWVEARPYSLWILLTVAQIFLFLDILKKSSHQRKFWVALGIVHIALSMTIFISVMQILTVSAILWFCVNKDWKAYWWVVIWPLVVNLLFFFKAYSSGVCFAGSLQDMIYFNFPADRLVFVLLFAVFLANKNKELESLKPFFLFAFVMLVLSVIMFYKLKMMETGNGSTIHMRHWLFLTPISIIATMLAFIHLTHMFRANKFILSTLFLGILGILWTGLSKVYTHFLSRMFMT